MRNQKTQLETVLKLILWTCLSTTSFIWASEDYNSTSPKQKINFGDLPRLVLEKNENVEAAKLHMNAQEHRRGRLTRSLLPQITAVSGAEQFKIDSLDTKSQEFWKLEATINLYRGGRDQIEDNIRNSNYELSQKSLQGEIRNELKEARKAFWTLVAINQMIDDKKVALTKNEQNIKAAKRRSGAGLTTTADAAQFELNQISIERELTKLELEKDVNQNQLSVALSIEDHCSIEVANEFPNAPDLSPPKEIAAEKLLAVQINKNLENIELLKADQASRWWLPKVDLYSTYGLPSLAEEYERGLQKQKQWATGVRLTIDLGQGFEDQQESKAKQAEAASFKKKVAHAIREGKAQSHDFNHDMNALLTMIKNADQDVKAAENFMKLTENEYSRGVKNGPDLLQANQTYFDFRIKRIQYYKDYFTSKAEQDSLVAE